MTYDLKNKVVLITGSTGGLGQAAAEALRARGARLALLDLQLEDVKAQAAKLGGADVAYACEANVCSMGSLEAAMRSVEQHFGAIDVVIAGAGIGFTEPMETMESRTFERTIDVNLNGVWRTFKAGLPYVSKRQGYMLAVSSMAAFVNAPLNAHYAASKAGVLAMCNSLRLEFKHLGVGVGTLHPTFFKTPMMDALMGNPCSELVFNNYQGIWKFVELETVVKGLVEGIASRREMITVPNSNALVARAPGLLRGLIERLGFNDQRVAEAVRVSSAAKNRDE
ncbi:SDR family NAD(P)-dependent oxidoreductase [Metapseudomonas otitidis]|uniref:SDR family NAD(P)-dependent oxidoreductase n=1 Tax=Metapseudomonas otitidis TaxID=319939 RepID=UPI003216C2A0